MSFSSVLKQVALVRTVEIKMALYCFPCTFNTLSTEMLYSFFFLNSERILITWKGGVIEGGSNSRLVELTWSW